MHMSLLVLFSNQIHNSEVQVDPCIIQSVANFQLYHLTDCLYIIISNTPLIWICDDEIVIRYKYYCLLL